jgi:hypothetical protein
MTAESLPPWQTPLEEIAELFDYLTPVQRDSVLQIVRAMADPEARSQ